MLFGLENVRCFAHPDPVRISPLTILVGENSTGKTSFLALLRIAQQIAQGHLIPSFNADPFLLGSYNQIAYRLPGQDAAEVFHLALSVGIPAPGQPVERERVEATFKFQYTNRGGSPHLEIYRFRCHGYTFELRFPADKSDENVVKLDFPSGSVDIPLPSILPMGPVRDEDGRWLSELPLFLDLFLHESVQTRQGKSQKIWREEANTFSLLAQNALRQLQRQPYAIAPVRSKPARTYDPIDRTPQAEGTHIPMKLAHIKASNNHLWQQLIEGIGDFGENAGLFEGLDIRSLGSEGDPFQILARISGLSSNLIDVGYGVSQILPILVDMLDGSEVSRLYLLQQPEVHLHPRAQAQLGSFLSDIVTQTQHHVAVETHSDYLIDRVRMSIRDERIPITAEDVSLLYFEHTGSEVGIHEITLDRNGDILDPPPSYRGFFMSELRRKFDI